MEDKLQKHEHEHGGQMSMEDKLQKHEHEHGGQTAPTHLTFTNERCACWSEIA
jgi:hypothetical protein